MASSGHFLAGKTIVIAGAGLAGLAFAIGIRKQWNLELEPPTTILCDRDSRDLATWRRGENYTVSITGYNEAGGLVALEKLGLIDAVLSKAIAGLNGTGSFTIWGPDLSHRFHSQRHPIAGLPTASIRIVRKELRRVLIDAWESTEHSSIQWNSQCTNVERTQNNRLRVYLKSKHEASEEAHADCDILIAADGANSKRRGILRPDHGLRYTGAVLRGGLASSPEGVPNTGVTCFVSPVNQSTVLWAVENLEEQPTKELAREATREQRRAVSNDGAKLGRVFQEPFPTMAKRTDSQ